MRKGIDRSWQKVKVEEAPKPVEKIVENLLNLYQHLKKKVVERNDLLNKVEFHS